MALTTTRNKREVFTINNLSERKNQLLEKDIEKRVSYEKDIQTPPRSQKKKKGKAPEKVISVVFFLIILSNLVYMAVAFMHH